MRGPGVAASSWQFSTKATIQPTRRLHPQTSYRYAKSEADPDQSRSTVGVAWGASHGHGGRSTTRCFVSLRHARGGEVSRGNRCVSFARVTTLAVPGSLRNGTAAERTLGVEAPHPPGFVERSGWLPPRSDLAHQSRDQRPPCVGSYVDAYAPLRDGPPSRLQPPRGGAAFVISG